MIYEKKSIASILVLSSIFLVFLVVFFMSLHAVSAIDSSNTIESITGVNSDNIPKNSEELNIATQGFVESQLVKFANSTNIVKMNNYFGAHQGFFKALFNEQYSFSGKFFWIITVWIFLLLIFSDLYGLLNLNKYGLNFILGVLSVWLLGIINLISALAGFLTSIISKPESFWFRVITFVIVLVVMVLIINFLKTFYKSIISSRKEGEIKTAKKTSKRAEKSSKRAEETAAQAVAVATASKEEDEDISDEEKEEIRKEAKEAAEGLGEEG